MSQSFIDVLNKNHSFPGEYIFRVIGDTWSGDGSLGIALEALLIEAGITEFRFEKQPSSKGKYTAYRIFAVVASAEQVADLTRSFQRTSGVKVVM